MRVLKFLALFSVALGMVQSTFAATADWAEEMNVLPNAPSNDKMWANKERDWISTVIQQPGGTWLNNVNDGNMGSPTNPTVDQQQYTIEYRFRMLGQLPTNQPGPVKPIWFHNSGAGGSPSQISRSRHWMSYHSGGSDLWFEAPGAGPNRFQFADTDLGGTGAGSYWNQPGITGEWHTVRTIFDNLAATPNMSIYIDGALIATVNNNGNSMMNSVDDPGIFIGNQPEPGNSDRVPVEWDYLRIKLGVVPISEALVPEPSSVSLLGLAGLALLRRRRS